MSPGGRWLVDQIGRVGLSTPGKSGMLALWRYGIIRSMDSFPDIRAMTGPQLRDYIKVLQHEASELELHEPGEMSIAYKQQITRNKRDLAEAELADRLR